VSYSCCDTKRRDLVAQSATLNAIDYLEVIDHDLPELDPLRQRTLLVHCVKPLPAGFSADNVRVLGGERVANIRILWAAAAAPTPAPLALPGEAATATRIAAVADATATLVVRTAVAGDFSTYTLRFVTSPTDDSPPPTFDPQLAAIDFRFKVECPSDFDCWQQPFCSAPTREAPEIDYLAKDYLSFRRLLLNRLSQLVPQWQQSSEADTGVAVAELLAYVGDNLSYQQDAIATEAYLGTARRRASLRRHALLVDYPMHDGCNARVWLQLQIVPNRVALQLDRTQFLTRCPGAATGLAIDSPELAAAMQSVPVVFEPLLDPRFKPSYQQTLYADHNRISFYTWSDERCCLPQGAIKATLAGSHPNLQVGDALLFEEVMGPLSGEPADADPTHRHVVRLTKVVPTPPAMLADPLTNAAVTEIEWSLEDALPFALCISGRTDEEHGSQYKPDISVARGNLVLADHGQRVGPQALGSVPPPALYLVTDGSRDRCSPTPPVAVAVRFRPSLNLAPLTQAAGRLITTPAGRIGTAPAPFDSYGPAAQALDWSMQDVLPQIALDGTLKGRTLPWQARRTLLNSDASATDFVVEIDDDGGAQLRFGDMRHGQQPNSGTAFTASYRVGNGTAGNVGADTIVHIVAAAGDLGGVQALRNPLPARGGLDLEDAESVRRNAPQAFRVQERAVTPADYAAVAQRDPKVQRAAATLRWTGSWYTVFITVDPLAGTDAAALKTALTPLVDRYRMGGHDFAFDDPQYVSLEIALHVCAKDDYFRSDVKQSLLQVLGNRIMPDGRRGLFHPDNFTFNQSVYVSRVYAAAHEVPGVASVQVTTFQRQGTDDSTYLRQGELPIGRLEIARLDNDPNFPEHGVLRLDVHGGK